MKVVLDLHGLHANDTTEVLEEYFLVVRVFAIFVFSRLFILLRLEAEFFYSLAYVVVGEQKQYIPSFYIPVRPAGTKLVQIVERQVIKT
ncbi:hypothetical protein BDP27DRAFT_346884 [Rhodocollybia butyracea]|uniref:Uncharacterized protein n=1 Tax=Rhodocollybia butyracea TaxID=206335 RepID=A0A9P5UGA2_9AGAR|nr:hypothetical protein BDP27DRAFT_346884 [Rhodocollybia butyracea]